MFTDIFINVYGYIYTFLQLYYFIHDGVLMCANKHSVQTNQYYYLDRPGH